jgi:hypothetical protein
MTTFALIAAWVCVGSFYDADYGPFPVTALRAARAEAAEELGRHAVVAVYRDRLAVRYGGRPYVTSCWRAYFWHPDPHRGWERIATNRPVLY